MLKKTKTNSQARNKIELNSVIYMQHDLSFSTSMNQSESIPFNFFFWEIKVTKTPVELMTYYTTELNIFSHA